MRGPENDVKYVLHTNNPYSDFSVQWNMYKFLGDESVLLPKVFKTIEADKEEEEMTMNAMVEYLEKKGFEVTKTYLRDEKKYVFEIIKNGKRASAVYTYNPYRTAVSINSVQREFLDGLIKQWNDVFGEEKEKEKNMDRNDVRKAFRQAAVQGLTGMLQVNGARMPVRLTCYRETNGDLDQIECEVPISDHYDFHLDERSFYHSHEWRQVRQLMQNALNSKYGKNAQCEPQIKDVIFSPPAVIVFWKDNTKTVVKAEGEDYDPEKGLAMAIAKKTLGNKHDYYNTFKKWLKKAPKQGNLDG